MKSLDDANQTGTNGRPPHGGRGLKYVAGIVLSSLVASAPTRGPWIEIGADGVSYVASASAPTRGPWIEIVPLNLVANLDGSAPTRGPWIEILALMEQLYCILSAPTRGPWIEMKSVQTGTGTGKRRPPHGGRGLKFFCSTAA